MITWIPILRITDILSRDQNDARELARLALNQQGWQDVYDPKVLLLNHALSVI